MIELTEQRINQFLNNLKEKHIECHSIVIIQNGKTILEKSFYPYQNNIIHPVYSVSKSFTSIAIGQLIEQKQVDLNDTWITYFPEYKAIAADHFDKVTIKDLLTMRMGQDEEPYLNTNDDWINNTISKPLAYTPGTHFFYDSMCTHLISALVQKITHMTLADYLDEILMKPLNITNYYWDSDQHGITAGGFGLHISTHDLAAFGHLLLNNGVYNNQQIISAYWIKEATRKQADTDKEYPPERTENRQGYGYYYWQCSHNAYRASGLHGQLCFVQPENKLVIAMNSATTGSQPILDCLYQAMYENKGSTDTVSYELPVIQGKKKSSAFLCNEIAMKALPNPAQIQQLKITQQDNQIQLTFTKQNKQYTIKAGYNTWLKQDNQFLNFTPTEWHCAMNDTIPQQYKLPAYANYAWITPTTLNIQLRALNDAAKYNFTFLLDHHYFTMRYKADALYSYLSSYEVVFQL